MSDGNLHNFQNAGRDKFCMTLHGLLLTVLRFDRCARYIVCETQHDSGSGPGLMLASGTADDMESALAAARRTAWRVRSVLTERRRERGRPT